VKDLIHSKREFIGHRVKEFREKLGLSHSLFAKGCGLSAGTIVTIEAGEKGYIIDSLLAITYFLGLELEEFASQSVKVPSRDAIVDRINDFHKKHHSKGYLVIDKKQRLSNILKERLLKTDFLSEPKEIGEIIRFCKLEYKVELMSSSVSNAMRSLQEQGVVKIIRPKKGRNLLYKKHSAKNAG
jgi:transcriptional regulator with XRE-family HTH domain